MVLTRFNESVHVNVFGNANTQALFTSLKSNPFIFSFKLSIFISITDAHF